MSALVSSVVAVCQRPTRWLFRALRWTLGLLALVWLLVLALWLILHWAILPNVDGWRPRIEAAATQALRDSGGARLQIGEIQVSSGGWMPVLSVRDLRLVDAQGQIALHLPQASAALSARSLLAWPPRLEQLYLHEPRLELRRDKQGRLWMAGIRLPEASAQQEPSQALDWLLRQYELALKGGSLRWVDEMGEGRQPLELKDVSALMRNGLRRHELRVDATPPETLGQRFSLRARLTQPLFARPAQWQRWSGLFYAELPQARAEGLREVLPLPFELSRGSGSMKAWVELARGQLRDISVDVGLQAVRLRVAPQLDALDLQRLALRLAWQRLADGSRWSLRGLQFALGNEGAKPPSVWSNSNATLSLRHAALQPWQPPTPESLLGGQMQADRIDLALLARLASGLPLSEDLHAALRERAPQGLLQSLELRWQGSPLAPASWQASGSAQRLAWAALPPPEATAVHPHPLGQPGLDGASLRFSAHQDGGEAQLQLRDGHLDYPGLLATQQLPLQRAEAQLRWQRDAQGRWQFAGRNLQLDAPALKLRGDFSWRDSGRPGGHLDLQAKAPQLALPALAPLLPQVVPESVRLYLQDSLLAGQARNLQVQLQGELADFPFRVPGSGVYRVQAQVQDARFAYVPSHGADAGRSAYQSPWPAFEALNGELRLEGPGLRLRATRARSAGLEFSDIDARIDDMAQQGLLRVGGRWRGELQTALDFVRQTPVHGWTHQALARAVGSGAVSGQLQLDLPLHNLEKSTVRGAVQFPTSGVQLKLRDDLPSFTQLRGGLEFSEHGLQFQGLQARFLGGALRVSGGTRAADGVMQIEAEGQASAEGLRAAAQEWPALGGLASSLSGQADYQLRLAFKQAEPELELRSSLQGLAANLPAPLGKAAADSLPLLLRVQPQGGGREAWGLSLGTQLQALLEREGVRTRRGAIRLGSEGPLSLPAEGVQLTWAAPQIDLDPWRQRAGAEAGGEGGWTPDRIQIETPVLRVAQRKLTQVSLSAQRLPTRQAWKLLLKADQAAGEAEWRSPSGQPPALQARLSRLALPPDEAQQVEQWLESGAQGPAAHPLPALDVEIDNFELRGKKLGALAIKAQGAAAGRDWSLQSLSLVHPDAKLSASGLYRAAERRTQLDWQLAIDNSGRWLDALGFSNTVRGGKGELKGVLGWRGSPLSPSSAGLDGQFSLRLTEGQFLKADPGVARLLGILSLQSLPRRLLFDWRDVFSSGFAFDEFAGDVKIDSGVARTTNLRMRGLQASVLMDGSADLRAETTDLRVLVIPDLDAGGATLAYAAVNPAVGLTAFLAQLILRKPIAAASTTELRVSGPWADPKVEKVERGAASSATASSSAPSSNTP